MNTPVITLKNIIKKFDIRGSQSTPAAAIEHINLEVYSGEIFIFVGPSGSGKSTLLRIMSGLEKEYDGQISLGEGMGRDHMSFIFQQFALLPWLSVSGNIELGLIARRVPEQERKDRVAGELKQFGLERFANAHPRELSGGMRQRVGIARALVTNPKIIFMDEPFSELDSFTAQALRKELLDIWKERKPTIVMVTHIVEEALELADRIAVLTPRPGRIERVVINTLPRPRLKRSEHFYKLEDELYRLIKP